MATCGYVCPKCEGNGYLDDGTICDWCKGGDSGEESDFKKEQRAESILNVADNVPRIIQKYS
jgi:hypothetical protein